MSTQDDDNDDNGPERTPALRRWAVLHYACAGVGNTEIHLPASFYTKHTINIKGHIPHQHLHSAGQPTASAQECAKDHFY